MRAVLTGAARMIATAWRMDRRKTIVSVVLMISGALAAPALAAALAWMTGAVVAGETGTAALAGVAVAVLAVAWLTFGHFAHIAYFELSELAELDFAEQLITLSNGSAGIEHHERPEHADTLTVLQQESRQFRVGLEALLNSLGLALAVTLTAILLIRVNPWLLLLPLAAIPPLFTGRLAERVQDRARTRTAEPTRVALNLFHLTTSAPLAGELRVFRLADELRGRHRAVWATATRGLWRAHLASTWLRAAGQIIFALAYAGAVLLVVRDALTGRRGVADVVLVIALAAQVNQQVTTAVTLLQDLQRMASAYRRLAGLTEVVTATAPGPADQSPPDRLRDGITLRDVSFTYPGTAAPVLGEVNLQLPAGSTVAIVGENGAGKTTLVKLLCGFYRPTAGQVLVDDTDLARIPLDGWRERIAAGFQDFVRYEFPAGQTVGVGDLPRIDDEPALLDALHRAQADDLLDRLTLDTQLGKTYADGLELSGGQWQKLALGRALMRSAPLLLVLDEPTSALDPQAEHALFERYAEQAKRVSEATGAITLFVSHRFSTVRMADLIIVVQDGRIAEAGTHDELSSSGGLYAELFALQARAYT
ncbi:ABC transporter ATP-binding protein [Acrocarpospora catenulata]|uniref:ABC transporter ATP-binding protein n=1 Tax=Acrocarpospora catenulata TaxID=2836182 RepID=UPI001BD9167F|nr:ABC transporter ATP-binding protein [Acrocarpospora catenulata]